MKRLGRLVRWHSQNLNERRDETCGPMWRHGRAWFYFFPQTDEEAERNYKRGASIGVEWKIPAKHYALEFSRGGYDDSDANVSVCCGLFALWLHFENFVPRKWHKFWNPFSNRALSLKMHNGAIWWNVWVDDDEWSDKTPKWRQGNFNPMDFIFGRHIYSNTVLETREVVIPMPEGTYAGTVKIEEATWKRPRSLFTKKKIRADIEVPSPPQFAGKGENSWGCDDDGIYGMTCTASTPEEAVGKYVAAVLENRKRYGMPSEVIAG